MMDLFGFGKQWFLSLSSIWVLFVEAWPDQPLFGCLPTEEKGKSNRFFPASFLTIQTTAWNQHKQFIETPCYCHDICLIYTLKIQYLDNKWLKLLEGISYSADLVCSIYQLSSFPVNEWSWISTIRGLISSSSIKTNIFAFHYSEAMRICGSKALGSKNKNRFDITFSSETNILCKILTSMNWALYLPQYSIYPASKQSRE